MKFFKVIIIAVTTVFAFGSAEAQIVVRTPRHPRTVVVVKKHVYHRHYRHPVVVVRHRR